MSAIEQITTLLETMSFVEKLTLNQHIATALRKEGGKVSPKKRSSKEEGAEKPKRKSSPGQLAWQAFVKQMKTTRPDAFTGITKESDKLQVVKGIRANETPAYDAFIAEWKANYALNQGAGEEAEDEEVVSAPVEVKASPELTPKQKIEALKASKAASASSPLVASPAAKPVKQVKKAVKAPAVAKAKAKENDVKQLPLLTLDDVVYWHEPENQGLWRKDSDNFSGENWTGYYQPGNEEEPIRYTDAYGDE